MADHEFFLLASSCILLQCFINLLPSRWPDEAPCYSSCLSSCCMRFNSRRSINSFLFTSFLYFLQWFYSYFGEGSVTVSHFRYVCVMCFDYRLWPLLLYLASSPCILHWFLFIVKMAKCLSPLFSLLICLLPVILTSGTINLSSLSSLNSFFFFIQPFFFYFVQWIAEGLAGAHIAYISVVCLLL